MINVKKAFILSGLAKKGDSNSSIELIKAGVWGLYPQPLRDFQHSTIIIKTQHTYLYFIQKFRENTYYNGEAQVCSS